MDFHFAVERPGGERVNQGVTQSSGRCGPSEQIRIARRVGLQAASAIETGLRFNTQNVLPIGGSIA